MASLILVEILASGEALTRRKGIILFQIVFVSANLIFGQTLRLPLYFGWTDVMGHMHSIETILETGRVTSALGIDYQYFPNFYIFGATGTMLSGMSLQTSYFALCGLLFLVSIPVVYLLVSQVTRNVYLPLVTALLYSQSREVIFNGMYATPRAMAFVFCLVILYLLIRGRTNWKLRAVAVFLVVPLVLMHQTTLLHFSAILIVLVIIELILHRRSWYIGLNYSMFFTFAYLGYWLWLCYPFLSKTIIDAYSAITMTHIPSSSMERTVFATFTANADLTAIAFLAIVGVVSLLHRNRELVTVGTVFSLFSLVAFLLYFPGPLGFLPGMFESNRLPLLVSPFIAFAAAGGLLLLVRQLPTDGRHWKSIIGIGITLCLVFFLSLSSTVILGNSTDLNLGKVLGNTDRQYFTESELAAFSYSYEHGQNIPYYGDYESLRYMGDYFGMT
ncbi:MAG: hypothetical protein MUO99_06810, partial [Dehalococcoidales bacterium]|nr:hypothetical protein [Dehalococcoidales bacterium]